MPTVGVIWCETQAIGSGTQDPAVPDQATVLLKGLCATTDTVPQHSGHAQRGTRLRVGSRGHTTTQGICCCGGRQTSPKQDARRSRRSSSPATASSPLPACKEPHRVSGQTGRGHGNTEAKRLNTIGMPPESSCGTCRGHRHRSTGDYAVRPGVGASTARMWRPIAWMWCSRSCTTELPKATGLRSETIQLSSRPRAEGSADHAPYHLHDTLHTQEGDSPELAYRVMKGHKWPQRLVLSQSASSQIR